MKALRVVAGLTLILGLTVVLARLAVPALAAPQVVNTIAGTVFQDNNLNGSLDDGEPGAPDVRLELYRDENLNGLIDKHDRRLAKSTTDEQGQYAFHIAADRRFSGQTRYQEPAEGFRPHHVEPAGGFI